MKPVFSVMRKDVVQAQNIKKKKKEQNLQSQIYTLRSSSNMER